MCDELAEIDRRRERLADEMVRLLGTDDTALLRLVGERAAKLDAEVAALASRIEDAEARAAEWDADGDGGLQDSVDLLRGSPRPTRRRP